MQHISVIANLASSIAVLAAVIFGILQVRAMAQSRAISSSAELVHAMNTPEFTRSVTVLVQLPDAADPELFRKDPKLFDAAQNLGHTLESLGVLVYHRVLPLHIVDDLMGGYVRLCWRKLSALVEARRRELGVFYGEWMQWLQERLVEFPSEGKKEGAHVSHRDWKP